jgi:hypothetical protein
MDEDVQDRNKKITDLSYERQVHNKSPVNAIEPKYPNIWNEAQYEHFCKAYSWLIAKNGFLGCRLCPILSSTKVAVKAGVDAHARRGSSEWISCKVSYNGKKRKHNSHH